MRPCWVVQRIEDDDDKMFVFDDLSEAEAFALTELRMDVREAPESVTWHETTRGWVVEQQLDNMFDAIAINAAEGEFNRG